MRGSNFDPFNQQQRAGRPVAGTPIGDEQGKPKKKRNEVLNFMFNPEIGESFKGVSEGHEHFVRLIANLFLQTGLIDASYPGFADPRQMKIITIMYMAYRNLEFTRDGLPRVLLFAAFVGSLFAVAISIILFFLTVAAPQQQQMPPLPK